MGILLFYVEIVWTMHTGIPICLYDYVIGIFKFVVRMNHEKIYYCFFLTLKSYHNYPHVVIL